MKTVELFWRCPVGEHQEVELQYFRPDGRYYSSGSFRVAIGTPLWAIFVQVRTMKKLQRLPGLVDGASSYHVLVNAPGHPDEHPHIVPADYHG
jgi:hypothetical protein